MRSSFLLKLGLLHAVGSAVASPVNNGSSPACNADPATLSLSDPPYENYFYSDCNVAAQVVITSPLPDSNLSIMGPRMIVAYPAGNSGVCAYFAPQNGVNGSLAIELVNSTAGSPLAPVYTAPSQGSLSGYPAVGVKSVLRFNSSAVLTVPILGSIRTIRDFVEGPSLLYPEIQNAINFTSHPDGSVSLRRRWLDNVTTSSMKFTPVSANSSRVTVANRTVRFEAGDYVFSTDLDYPQLTQLEPSEVLNSGSQQLIEQQPGQTTALSFLSYSEKLLAGAWRFLTYFGRDSMISALLLEPVLSNGNGSAMEAVIGAVLERLNRTDGTACHEETLGDYATWMHKQDNVTSNAMICDYKMIDTDYFLPVLMQKYFLDNKVGRKRWTAFSNIPAGSIDSANKNLTYGQLAVINAERIIRLSGPFVRNQTKDNLIHLKDGEVVGEWRDSTYGIGGGRIPYDVNTALVPAALRSIAALARAGVYRNGTRWAEQADRYAKVWEDKTLEFFEVTVPQREAKQRIASYVDSISFPGPNQTDTIDADVHFYAVALDGNNNLSKVEVMNTDDCFRHFLLNTTHQPQLTAFLNQTANNVRRTFPAGLMTDASMVVANPAYGTDPVYARNFTTGAYHGTVIWSWQLAMMAKGLEHQLGRCEQQHGNSSSSSAPEFCRDTVVYPNVKAAYNALWDSIEANTNQLAGEVWSWVYRDDEFQVTPLGVLPPPPGMGGQTESNIRQLWSLTFLGVTRNKAFN